MKKSRFRGMTPTHKSVMDLGAMIELEIGDDPDKQALFAAFVQRCGDQKTLSGEYDAHEDDDEPDTDEGD